MCDFSNKHAELNSSSTIERKWVGIRKGTFSHDAKNKTTRRNAKGGTLAATQKEKPIAPQKKELFAAIQKRKTLRHNQRQLQ